MEPYRGLTGDLQGTYRGLKDGQARGLKDGQARGLKDGQARGLTGDLKTDRQGDLKKPMRDRAAGVSWGLKGGDTSQGSQTLRACFAFPHTPSSIEPYRGLKDGQARGLKETHERSCRRECLGDLKVGTLRFPTPLFYRAL